MKKLFLEPKTIDPDRYALRDGEKVGAGYSSTVYAATGLLQGATHDRMLSLVHRVPDFSNEEYQRGEFIMHALLQQADIPVTPTFRKAPDGSVYATDLTKNKTHYVISFSNSFFDTKDMGQWALRKAPPYEHKMEVMQQASDIAMQCARLHITLAAADGLYLQINKQTRDTKILAGDFKHFSLSDQASDEIFAENIGQCSLIFFMHKLHGFYGLTQKEVDDFFVEAKQKGLAALRE